MEEEQTVKNLVASLEQATLMAKHLSTTTDPSQISQIVSSLHASHHHLSAFLALSNLPPPPNSSDDDPMQVADAEDDGRNAVKSVEERMKDFFIQNKRPKRPLSPSAEMQRSYEKEQEQELVKFDPERSRLRSLNLIYQFHS